MNWSEYQLSIFEAVEKTNDSLLIEAVAGSGKTTTIVEAIKHVPRTQSVAFLAFNKSIADELGRRITSPNAVCKTLHAMGFAAWRDFLGGKSFDCKVDNVKTRMIVKDRLNTLDRVRYGAEMGKLISIAKGSGIVPSQCEEHYLGISPDDDEAWEDLISFYDLERDGCSLEVVREVLAYSIDISSVLIDYDDMLYMPIIVGARMQKFDVVFLDEAQDVNGIQVEMVSRMLKPTSRVIAVGDRHQAIYGFRGALSNSMEHIADRFKCRSLPLSVSYRCPKSIVKKAQTFVSHIQHHESAPEGIVTEYPSTWPLENFLPTDAILCRNSRPLIGAAFHLIRHKISCKVLGRDIGQGLIKIVKKMKARNIIELIRKLNAYRIVEIQKARARDDEAKVAALEDKLDTIHVFIDEEGPESSVDALIASIESLFSDQSEGRLTLSTVHKAKGLEWERVFILDAHFLMPSRYAKKPWQREQEINLQYVAATRGKRELFYISSESLGMECKKKSGSLQSAPTEDPIPMQVTSTEDSEAI